MLVAVVLVLLLEPGCTTLARSAVVCAAYAPGNCQNDGDPPVLVAKMTDTQQSTARLAASAVSAARTESSSTECAATGARLNWYSCWKRLKIHDRLNRYDQCHDRRVVMAAHATMTITVHVAAR